MDGWMIVCIGGGYGPNAILIVIIMIIIGNAETLKHWLSGSLTH